MSPKLGGPESDDDFLQLTVSRIFNEITKFRNLLLGGEYLLRIKSGGYFSFPGKRLKLRAHCIVDVCCLKTNVLLEFEMITNENKNSLCRLCLRELILIYYTN